MNVVAPDADAVPAMVAFHSNRSRASVICTTRKTIVSSNEDQNRDALLLGVYRLTGQGLHLPG